MNTSETSAGWPGQSLVSRPQEADWGLLLAWLDSHATTGGLVRQAVLQGLAARIRRGDFNTKENAS